MRLLRITMKQCGLMRGLRAEGYLGTRLGSCPLRIEHVLVVDRRVRNVSAPCDQCVLAKLYQSTHVIGTPLLSDDYIVFYARDNRQVRRILREHMDRVVGVDEIDYREIYLTSRQRQALRLLASGEATNISRLARKLRISKSAALRLVRRAIKKLAYRHIHDLERNVETNMETQRT